MKRYNTLAFSSGRLVRAGLFAIITAGLLSAQSPSSNGWPKADDTTQTAQTNPGNQPGPAAQAAQDDSPPPNQGPQNPGPQSYPNAPSGPVSQPNGGYQQAPPYAPNPTYGQGQGYPSAPPQPSGPVPDHVTIAAGTFVTVTVNQTLSSDKNHPGDAFSATLAAPIIANGVVVAQRGQTLGGRVVAAEKAGRVEGTSKLQVQLTDLTLVDGTQTPIQSQFINWRGPTSVGRDAAAVAGTTGLGAAIGAAADWGRGAAIGAGAGAAAGVIGVLLTRGRPTVIPPESVLTFRVQAPVIVATDRAPQAFRYAEAEDYGRPVNRNYASAPPVPSAPPCGGYGCGPTPYYYGPAYYPYSYPYWGPSVVFYGGPGFYYRPYYRGYYYRPYGYRR